MCAFEGITIAICTRNRPDDLKRCVDSIARSSIPAHAIIEVIIIDDGNLDDIFVQGLIAALQPRLKCSYYKKYEPGLFLSRIQALRLAEHPIVLFFDDDVEIEGEYLRTLQDTYAECPDLAGVGGIDVLLTPPNKLRQLFGYIFCLNSGNPAKRSRSQFGDSMIYWKDAATSFETDFLSGCNMSFRKAALQRLEPVGWLQHYSFCEDVYLSYTARRRGRLIINPGLKVRHNQTPVSRDKVKNVAYMEIVNSYHLMEFENAGVRDYMVLIWSGIGKLLSCGIRDNKAERFGGYVNGLAKVARLLTQKWFRQLTM